jgi:UDP-glucose 4-epimerase
MRVVVIGADGFVGSAVCRALVAEGHDVLGCVRNASAPSPAGVAWSRIGIGDQPDTGMLRSLWAGADTVVHAAGWAGAAKSRADSMRRREADLALAGTIAAAASGASVRHVVAISSIKAVGNTTGVTPFDEATPPNPSDIYGKTKCEAEALLRAGTHVYVTALRPPLIYGPGMKSSLLRLFAAAERSWPLPLGAISNRRDLLWVGSAAEVVAACVRLSTAAPPIVLARDGEALSTPDLHRQIGAALGRPVRLWSLPPVLMDRPLRGLGRRDLADSLFASLQIDDSRSRERLSWRPATDANHAMRQTAEWFRAKIATGG